MAYCEIQEQLKNLDEVNATYNRFIESLQAELESLERAQQTQHSKSDSMKADQDAANDDEDAPYDPNAPPANLIAAAQPSAPSSPGSNNVQELTLLDRKQELGIVWISYMKFARRSESQKSARAVFSKFRKTKKWITWEVFEAAGECLLQVLPADYHSSPFFIDSGLCGDYVASAIQQSRPHRLNVRPVRSVCLCADRQ